MAENLGLFEKRSKSKEGISLDPEEVVREIFACTCLKKERYKNVLAKRYGLFGNEKETLETIGKELGITRERVRQIESTAIKRLKNPRCGKDHTKKISAAVIRFLDQNGGFASQEKLLKKFAGSVEKKNAFGLLLQLNKKIQFIKENSFHTNVWVSNDELGKHAKQIIEKAHEYLKKRGSVIHENELLKELESEIAKGILILNMLESAKNIAKVKDENVWGLRDWGDVNPRSIKDRVYVILKRDKNPMHFSEIAKKINSAFEEVRKVTEQAVHNELIKDDRFVLIGRGIYALSEWGYQKGIVEEVISEILKEAGKPLHKNEIVERVLGKRMVKEATIVLNLQKERFKRVGKATYALND